MTRQRLALYCAVGALAYLAALVAMLPASWISRALERASAEKLIVRAPEGTLWTGRARVYARERSGPPLELGELRWKTAGTDCSLRNWRATSPSAMPRGPCT
jgi:hypothetical protein